MYTLPSRLTSKKYVADRERAERCSERARKQTQQIDQDAPHSREMIDRGVWHTNIKHWTNDRLLSAKKEWDAFSTTLQRSQHRKGNMFSL